MGLRGSQLNTWQLMQLLGSRAPANADYLDPSLANKKTLNSEQSVDESSQKAGTIKRDLTKAILSDDNFYQTADRAAELRPLLDQGKGIQSLEEQFSEFNKMPYQTNLSPTIALVDSLTGSDLLKGYKAPQSPQDREEFKLKIADMIQKRREADSLANIRAMIGQKTPQIVVGQATTDTGEKNTDTVKTEAASATPPPVKLGGKGMSLKPMGESAISKFSQLQQAVEEAQSIPDFIKANAGAFGTKGKIKTLLPNMFGLGEDEKEIDAYLRGGQQIIGKMIEGGVLRKEDEIKYKRILPTIGDEPDVALQKAQNFSKKMSNLAAKHLETYERAGHYDISGFKDLKDKYRGDSNAIPQQGAVGEPKAKSKAATVTDDEIMNSPEVQAILNKKKSK